MNRSTPIQIRNLDVATLVLCSAVLGGCGDDSDVDTEPGSTSVASSTGDPGTTETSEAPTTSSSTDAPSSSGDPTADTSTGSEPMACEEDPDRTQEGNAIPLDGFEFRNAFDPADRTVYDPDDPAALPGPVMVDAWGDRARGAHGTLGVFPPGFAAPLHTHSEAYDGVVLRGEMTNPFGTDLEVFLDDDARNDDGDTVLGPGSYWHVPAGSQHTTTCVGPEVCWFYFHSESAFDFAPLVDETGALLEGVELEAPDPEAVELPSEQIEFAGEPGSFVQFGPAWGSMADAAHGTFGVFEAGAVSPVHVHSEAYYGVVVSGTLSNPFNLDADPPPLGRGGYWDVPADAVHVTQCAEESECRFYFHARGGFDFTPLCEQPG